MRLFFAVTLCLVPLAPASLANLKRYDIRSFELQQFSDASPRAEFRSVPGVGTAVIDNAFGSGAPLLKTLVVVTGGDAMTTDLPGLSGFIFLSLSVEEGPDPDRAGSGDVTTHIDWGELGGWTRSGGVFCHAVPSSVCDFIDANDNTTVPPDLLSSSYDLGSWFFHGTGFTATPYLALTSSEALGNVQQFLRGVASDGSISALPLLGLGAITVSVLALGRASLRQRVRR